MRIIYTTGLLLILAVCVATLDISVKGARQRKLNQDELVKKLNSMQDLGARNEAKIDASNDQLLGFMTRTTQYLDYLQTENPQLKVPKSKEPRAPNAPPISYGELERPKFEHPRFNSPTPAPKVILQKGPVRYKTKVRPWRWSDLFKPRSSPTPHKKK